MDGRGWYDKLFDFFWTPFAVIAKVLIEWPVVQRSRYAPWMLGACVGRWPEKAELSEDEKKQLDELLKR